MASRILVSVGVAGLATCCPAAAQTAQPFVLEHVDFTPDCTPNAAFDRLLGLLLPGLSNDRDDTEAAFDEPLFDAVSAEASHVLRLRREAAWHGLRLAEIRFLQGIESGPTVYTLAFADDPERVRAVWNARGWNLPPAGETRVIDDKANLTAVGIGTDGPLAAVSCYTD